MYKNNSLYSSKFKGCSPLQLLCDLKGKYHAIGYYYYTHPLLPSIRNSIKDTFLLKDKKENRKMIANTQNSTFANPATLAKPSVYKKAIFCLSHGAKIKRTAPIRKQPFQLTNFCPFGAITPWTWRKYIRIIIKSDYFSAFYAFVATLSGLFTCSVHKNKFKRLKTCSTLIDERLLILLFCRTNFNFFSYGCRRSTYSFSFWNKLSCTCISHSCRCFTHYFKNFNYKTIITYYLTAPYLFSSLTKKRKIQLI